MSEGTNEPTPHLKRAQSHYIFKGHGGLAYHMTRWLREYDDFASEETKRKHGEQIDEGVFYGFTMVLTSLSHHKTQEGMTSQQEWKAISKAVHEAAAEELNTWCLLHLRDYCYDVAHRLSYLGDDQDDTIDEVLQLINDYFAELYSESEKERWGGRG